MRAKASDEQPSAMTIRTLGDADREAVERLAQRDSRPPPDAPLLGIEVDGELVAATSLFGGTTVADPFAATAEPRAMLELRAAQLRRAAGRRNGRSRGLAIRLRGYRARGALPGSPPGAGGRLLTLRG